jgi:hypothetical protein
MAIAVRLPTSRGAMKARWRALVISSCRADGWINESIYA